MWTTESEEKTIYPQGAIKTNTWSKPKGWEATCVLFVLHSGQPSACPWSVIQQITLWTFSIPSVGSCWEKKTKQKSFFLFRQKAAPLRSETLHWAKHCAPLGEAASHYGKRRSWLSAFLMSLNCTVLVCVHIETSGGKHIRCAVCLLVGSMCRCPYDEHSSGYRLLSVPSL